MKKMLICCGVLCMAFLLFCGSAMAADLTATVTEVDKSAVSVQEASGKYTVTKNSGAESGQLYLVLFQKVNAGETASVKAAPTKENVYFMDVVSATGTSVTISAYPKEMDAGTYVVYLSDYSQSGAATGVATIALADAGGGSGTGTGEGGGGSGGGSGSGETPTPGGDTSRKLGDINNDGTVSPSDAVCALQMYVGIKNNGVDWTEAENSIADVNHDGANTPSDATMILQYYVGIIAEKDWK